MTAAHFTDLWLERRRLRTDDETRTVIRKRLGACLIALRPQGQLVNSERIGDLKGWRLA